MTVKSPSLYLWIVLFFSFPLHLSAAQPVVSTIVSRMDSQTGPAVPGIPAGLIYENRSNPYLFWVELDTGQLHLLERIEADTYVSRKTRTISIGKNGSGKEVEGDLKTPIGVYQITSYLDDKELDDFYGAGAYPVNFPNTWDRLLNRSGHGIWLHGLPKGVDSRPMLDSEGCIILDNNTMRQLDQYVTTGESLFVLGTSLNWLPPGTPQSDSDILSAIDEWRHSWEDNDINRYLANYHADFTDRKKDLSAWSVYKRQINRNKTYIKVKLSEMSVIEYPGEDNLVAVRFYQDYTSSNYNWQGWKHLLWRRDDNGVWRIFYEGNG